MSSSTKAIVAKNSTMNNNERKRPISSPIRLSSSSTSAKRRELSLTTISRKSTTNKTHSHQTEQTLQKSSDNFQQPYRPMELTRSVSLSSSSTFLHQIDSTSIIAENSSETAMNEIVEERKLQRSLTQTDFPNEIIFTKRGKTLPLIVKPTKVHGDQRNSQQICDSDDEFEPMKSISEKSITATVVVPSAVMAIVTAPDLTKKSVRTTENNVIIQQVDANLNTNSSTKLVKLVVPPSNNNSSSPSIKMLSSGDGLASALRVPAKIQLTKTSLITSKHSDANFSSVSTHSINAEQSALTSSAGNLLDIPIDMTEKQHIEDQQIEEQSTDDYQPANTTTSLPPTPPPPVIDPKVLNHRSNLFRRQNENQREDNSSTTSKESSNKVNSNLQTSLAHQTTRSIVSKYDVSHVDRSSSSSSATTATAANPTAGATAGAGSSNTTSDWSVPPTIELSPTSITSSSPDLSQNLLFHNDSCVEYDSNVHGDQCRLRSSSSSINSSVTMCLTDGNDLQSKTSKRSSNVKLSLSPRLQRRRHDPETTICHQTNVKIEKGSSTKAIQFQTNDHLIIQGLLNDMIEAIESTNNPHADNTLINLLNTPVPKLTHSISVDLTPKKRGKSSSEGLTRTTTSNKKRISASQSLDPRGQNESRSRIMTEKELDEMAYLLHANARRADLQRNDNSTDVEQRLREIWSQMTLQKKNVYYKRVLKIYKRPNRDVAMTSSNPIATNINEKNSTMINLQTKSIEPTENSTPILVAPAHLTSMTIELQRQTSTPLSFHSVPSSIPEDQSISSPQESVAKTAIFADVVNELINGVKGLDKLSCTPASFTNAIHEFVRSNLDKQSQTVKSLEKQVENKCSSQLTRATIFWSQKINYFAMKHSINSSKDIMNELTLIVKYFYLFVLSLKCRKQETAREAILTDLLNGKLTFSESFCSPVLTSIIEDLILRSSLANDYLLSQPIIIGQIEYSLPFVRNIEYENELLSSCESFLLSNPFTNDQELEDFLNHCGHVTTNNIPVYSPVQSSHHSSMYYPTYHQSTSYYYRPPSSTAEMNNYYYNSPSNYPSVPPMYSYNPSTSYYPSHPHLHHPTATSANIYTNNNNEQYSNYYYSNQSAPVASYSAVPNSNMDIPLQHNNPHHRAYRPMAPPNMARKYNHSQQVSSTSVLGPTTPGTPSTPTVFDTTTVVSPQKEKVDESLTPVPSSSSSSSLVDQIDHEKKTIDESKLMNNYPP